jgi:magnesium-transporting ATPase (P-type)
MPLSTPPCFPRHCRLYEFEGAVVHIDTHDRSHLDASALLLRGCTLRKTQWVLGIVVFAGYDTKMMQNATKALRKATSPPPDPLATVPFVARSYLATSSRSSEMSPPSPTLRSSSGLGLC